jgi:hypothetical protein
VVDEYLTISEVAARLKVKPKTVKNKMAVGICLTPNSASYTLRIHDRNRAEDDTEAAWLVAGAACRRDGRSEEQHRAPGAWRAGDFRTAGAPCPADRGGDRR